MPRTTGLIDLAQVLRLRAAKLTIRETAAFIGCSISGVNKILKRSGHTKKRTRPSASRGSRKPRIKVVKAREQVAQAVPVAARSWFEV